MRDKPSPDRRVKFLHARDGDALSVRRIVERMAVFEIDVIESAFGVVIAHRRFLKTR
jgi:hypothetical protein